MAVRVMDVATLKSMDQAELDDLFLSSPGGAVPAGEADGTVLCRPGARVEELAGRIAHLLSWKGKVFDPAAGELRNRVLPEGIPATAARVYPGPSWVDGRDSVVVDYSRTSLTIHWTRDEIREVAPGLYLGVVLWDRRRILNFALDFAG